MANPTVIVCEGGWTIVVRDGRWYPASMGTDGRYYARHSFGTRREAEEYVLAALRANPPEADGE